MKRIRHKLNAEGDFFVEDGMCITCLAPESEAPELIGFDEKTNHCYFKKQPETEEEIEHAILAVHVSCCEGVQYEGNNPEILKRLQTLNFNIVNTNEKNLIQRLFERLLDIFR